MTLANELAEQDAKQAIEQASGHTGIATLRLEHLTPSLRLPAYDARRWSKRKLQKKVGDTVVELEERWGVVQEEWDKEVELQVDTAEQDGLVGWSRFPPKPIREKQAAVVMQGVMLRFLRRRARKKLKAAREAAAVRLQRVWRVRLQRKAWARHFAAIPIQALWRGYYSRKHTLLTRKYNSWP